MENKYVKYFLVVAVIAVWGGIVYRVVKGLSQDEVAAPVTHAPVLAQAPVAEEAFVLNADYPDPFLPDADTATVEPVVKTPAVAAPASTPPPAGTPSPAAVPRESITDIVQFNGIIANPQKKSRVALLTIRGKEYVVREKERVSDMLIRKIAADKVTLIYKGRSYQVIK